MKNKKEHGILGVSKEKEDHAFPGLTKLGKNFHGTAKPNMKR